MKKLNLPLTKEVIRKLKAGNEILLSGKLYTARDQAHKRMCEAIKADKKVPIQLKGNIIYYCGPAPAKSKQAIGSCGPTTSKRMDRFTPRLLAKGLAAMMGKGKRAKEVIEAIKKHKAVYLLCVGGAGAFYSTKVKRARPIAYKDLGPEAVYELTVKDFPAIVAIDSKGKDIFKHGGINA